MSTSSQHVVWIKRDGTQSVPDAVLRERASVDDSFEVKTISVGRWEPASIPADSINESGEPVSVPLDVWFDVLPPEGRVFLVSD